MRGQHKKRVLLSFAITVYLFFAYLILTSCATFTNVHDSNVHRIDNLSSTYVPTRNIDVWLPNNYNAKEQYAVLYMHDGQMLFDSTNTWTGQEWGVDETMDQLLKENKVINTIVVGIWNTPNRHSEYFPEKPFRQLPQSHQDSLLTHNRNSGEKLFKTDVYSDNYLKFIVNELKPYIDSTYSTNPEMQNTFIAGSSMGGLISFYAICEYPDVFSGAACLSTHWIGTFDTLNNPIPNKIIAYLDEYLPDPTTHKIYFDHGTETLDALYELYQKRVDTIISRHGYDRTNWKTIKFEGENHTEDAWKKRLHIPLQFLLKKPYVHE